MQTENLHQVVMNALEDLKAENIITIDVHCKTSVTDEIVIASGTSTRHVKSIANNVVQDAKEASVIPIGIETDEPPGWVLVDLGDVVVHVMLPEIRVFYDLESLWRVDGNKSPVEPLVLATTE